MSWFADNLWALWLLAVLVFAIIEIFSLDFFCLMLSGAALVAAGSTAFIDSLPAQVLVFAAVSLLLLLAVRPRLVNKLRKNSTEAITNSEALIGQRVEVLENIDRQRGLVRLAGDTWTARPAQDDLTIPRGAYGTVVRIQGATAIIEPSQLMPND